MDDFSHTLLADRTLDQCQCIFNAKVLVYSIYNILVIGSTTKVPSASSQFPTFPFHSLSLYVVPYLQLTIFSSKIQLHGSGYHIDINIKLIKIPGFGGFFVNYMSFQTIPPGVQMTALYCMIQGRLLYAYLLFSQKELH